MIYIISNAANSTDYAIYANTSDKDLAVIQEVITIKGGSGVINKNFITPEGVVTEVTDAQYELLKKDPSFQQHLKNKTLAVVTKKDSAAPEKIASTLYRDNSSPVRPSDYAKSNGPVPEDVKQRRA